MRLIITTLAPCLLIGCGGAFEFDEPDPTTRQLADLETLAASNVLGDIGDDAMARLTRLTQATLDPAQDIPTDGTVDYAGHLGFGDAQDGVLGEMDVSINFSQLDGSISGSVENFVDETGTPVQGALTLSDLELNRAADPDQDWQIISIIQGDLEWNGSVEEIYGSIYGEFHDQITVFGGGAEFYHFGLQQTIKGGFAVIQQ